MDSAGAMHYVGFLQGFQNSLACVAEGMRCGTVSVELDSFYKEYQKNMLYIIYIKNKYMQGISKVDMVSPRVSGCR